MPKKKTPKLPKKETPNQAAHKEAKRRKLQTKEGFSPVSARIAREATKDYPP